MPNHVQNRVIMTGDQTRINELLRTVQNDEEGPGTIDFNKIIPMPKDLEIECGSRSEHGFKAYADFISIYLLGQKDGKIDVFSVPESSEKAFLKAKTDIDLETWRLGKQSYHNIIKYGYANWYDWSIDNWGTKWNAYSFGNSGPDTLTFCTAWSNIKPVMTRLSEMYPDVDFNYAWADEDFGNNVGEVEIENGEITFENFPGPQSKDAYELAADIHGIEPEDRGLVFNDEIGNYEYHFENEAEQPNQSM